MAPSIAHLVSVMLDFSLSISWYADFRRSSVSRYSSAICISCTVGFSHVISLMSEPRLLILCMYCSAFSIFRFVTVLFPSC